MKNSLIFLCLLICICMTACSKQEEVIQGTFGYDESSVSKSNNSSNVDIIIETAESNQFKIDEDVDLDVSKSDEEKSMEKAEQYLESDAEGNISDERDRINYYGLLLFIKESGGIEGILQDYNKEDFESIIGTYSLVSESEKEAVLEAIYNPASEERNLLIRDILHTNEGWVLTEDGWTNVYEETNDESVSVIE